ncbi:uncharacterized protein HaLaN_13381 [Haematococcus lacustris]|uniref:Uncharacterized protein n=1 Tax=Haematococcus lacustris TaxID=44745 RepID=A0A699ZC65_HAELA|nr:uncharacterized protein HaLaN_13381 [Haematococcus lacustris]
MAKPMRVLGVIFPRPADASSAIHFDACSSIQDLVGQAKDDIQVRLLQHPTFAEFKQTVAEFQPTLVYLCGSTSYDTNRAQGNLSPIVFRGLCPAPCHEDPFLSVATTVGDCIADGQQPADVLANSVAGVETVYLDALSHDQLSARLQAEGVQHSIVWPEGLPVPAIIAAQFSHTFFCCLLHMRTSMHEAFALANHGVQAHCTTQMDGQYVTPLLPALFSPLKAQLPDNNSIPNPVIPGIDPSIALAAAIPGWADIRLLAPRAELRLLLTGNSCLIDGQKLSYLGEALRALLVLEMRGLTLLSTLPCAKTPANLPVGCSALRCEVRTVSGAQVTAILGGQPSFRLPPPSVPTPTARSSPVVAGDAPVVDAMVLTSVWAVQVLRSVSLSPAYKSLISLGVAAVGGTATAGVSAVDAQRLKIMVTGQGPSVNMFIPIQAPGIMGALAGMEGMMSGAEAFLTTGVKVIPGDSTLTLDKTSGHVASCVP